MIFCITVRMDHAKFTPPFMREKGKMPHFLLLLLKVTVLKGLIFMSGRTRTVERNFQRKLVRELKEKYPEAIIFKNEAIQGIPDLLILERDKWAALECKRSKKAPHRPNQDYYVDKMNDMSFARFIYPENKEEVLNELEQALKP